MARRHFLLGGQLSWQMGLSTFGTQRLPQILGLNLASYGHSEPLPVKVKVKLSL